MKAFLVRSPASAASAADSRGYFLFGGPVLGFSRALHRLHRLVHVSSEVRPDPTNPFWLLFPHTGAIPVIFNAPLFQVSHRSSSTGKMLHLHWFSVHGGVKKSSGQLGSPGTFGCRKLGGQIVALYGGWKVRVWNLEDWGWLETETMCTCGERYLNYDEEKFSKKIENCYAILISCLRYSGLHWL